MIELSLLTLLGGGLLWLAFREHGKRLRGWQDAAVGCGLEIQEGSVWKQYLRGRSGPLAVLIEAYGDKGQLARIAVSIPGPPGFSSVLIRREPLLRRRQEMEIGDGSFDRTFLLDGPTPQVSALLDAETRRLLDEVNTVGRLELSAGELQVDDLPDEMVQYVLRLLLDIGRRFLQPVDVPRRLAENALRDPEAGVRLSNLLALAGERPGDPETIAVLRTACADPSPKVRLRAAGELGPEGNDLLLRLAESLEDDEVSAEAVSILDRALPFERTKALLDHSLETRHLQTARACLEALGRSGDTAAAEAPLLQALQGEDASLRIAAANALGHAGSAAAVLPLQEAAERSWLDLDLRRAARQAITEIQSRLQDAAPGQLSLAGAEGGQLSLAPSEGGQVALAPHETPQDEPSSREQQEMAVRRG